MSNLPKSFIENNKDINEDEALEGIFESLKNISTIKESQANDPTLKDLMDKVKDLKSGYSSLIKQETAKIKFYKEKIEDIRGDNVNPNSSVKEK